MHGRDAWHEATGDSDSTLRNTRHQMTLLFTPFLYPLQGDKPEIQLQKSVKLFILEHYELPKISSFDLEQPAVKNLPQR